MRFASSFVIGLCFLLSTAWAQEPLHSLSELPQRVNQGDRIQIVAPNGSVVSGRFDGVSGSTLRVTGSGKTPRDFSGAMIKEILKRRPDSLWNGSLIGLGAGAAGGVIATNAECSNDLECSAITGLVFIPLFAGGGAAIGAIIDRLIERYEPIYRQQGASVRTDWHVVPIVSRQTKGVLVSMSF